MKIHKWNSYLFNNFQNNVDIAWYGWADPLSDIAEYDIEVYKLSVLGDTLGYAASAPLLREMFTNLPSTLLQFTFPEPGTNNV